MTIPFCDHHTITFLTRLKARPNQPLDLALSEYFRQHKSLGARDRRTIGQTVYDLTRWKGLLDYMCSETCSISDRLRLFLGLDWEKVLANPTIPEPLRLGVTPYLFAELKNAYGYEEARKLCKVFGTSAPVAIRANRLKISREDLLAKWKELFSVKASTHTPDGIVFAKREALFALPEFKEGLFEMQDEGSQLVASLVAAQSGEHVLDYCSGSGGKTLAFAPAMQGKGQIYLHDVRANALLQARKRCKRAGIQHVQFLPPEHPKLPQLQGKMDWVLADVPCSGTGTLRRHPEMTWNIDKALVERLLKEQRQIFDQAISYVRPGGRIVYATCSILPKENEEQTNFFQSHYNLTPEGAPLAILPIEGGMDGFYGRIFKKI